MDVVLGVSMTPTTARLVLVEGAGADGRIVDTDTIEVSDSSETASDQVLAAIVGTRDGMVDSGHQLISTGVVWSDHAQAAALRDTLADRGIDGVEFFSPLHAGGALAKAASNVTGYARSALLVVEPETAILAVVDSADGSVVGLASESVTAGVTPGMLAALINPLKGQENAPDGVFLLGLGTDVTDLAEPLGEITSLPVDSPDQPELALARGAALASAQAPDFEASTALLGQAYSLDPDGPTSPAAAFARSDAVTAGADAETELSGFKGFGGPRPERKPFLLIGAPLLLVFAICAVALAVSLKLNVSPTVDQGPSAPDRAVVNNPLPAQAPVQQPAPAPIQTPVQQVVAPQPVNNPAPAAPKVAPAPKAPAPKPEAPAVQAPAPQAPPPAPAEPPAAAPVPEAPAPEMPAPAPAPAVVPLPIPLFPPIFQPPRQNPWWPPRGGPTYSPPSDGRGGYDDGPSRGGSRGGYDDGPSRGGRDGGSRGGYDDGPSRDGSRGGYDDGPSRGGRDSGSRGGYDDVPSRGGSSGGSHGGWDGGGSRGGSGPTLGWPFPGR